jgi:hypothetical protein
MSPRLQARIPKRFGWDIFPRRDVYIWIDSSFRLSQPDSAKWFVDSLGQCDFAFFRHPWRTSIGEEARIIRQKILAGSRYLKSRYEGEDIDGQLKAIDSDYKDECLFATMAFAYRPTLRAKEVLTDWWVHTSRFHAVDQLAIPYLVWKHSASVATLDGDPYKSKWIEYTRNK